MNNLRVAAIRNPSSKYTEIFRRGNTGEIEHISQIGNNEKLTGNYPNQNEVIVKRKRRISWNLLISTPILTAQSPYTSLAETIFLETIQD